MVGQGRRSGLTGQQRRVLNALALACALGLAWILFPGGAIYTQGQELQPPDPSAPPSLREPAPPSLSAYTDGFESESVVWKREESDAAIALQTHDRSDQAAREGKRSEHLRFNAGLGSQLFYTYELPKIPATANVRASLGLRSNHVGAQFFARITLPKDVDPETGQPSRVVVGGVTYKDVDRWQTLELTDLPRKIEQQALSLRVKTKRPVPTQDAYVDLLVLNLYAGQGDTEVFIDDLRIAPVPPQMAVNNSANANDEQPNNPTAPSSSPSPKPNSDKNDRSRWDLIQLTDGLLTRKDAASGQAADWVFMAVNAPGADLDALARAGFDVLNVPFDDDPQPELGAVQRGFLLLPDISSLSGNDQIPNDVVLERLRDYSAVNSVAFWNLGEALGGSPDRKTRAKQRDRIRSVASAIARESRSVGFSPYTTGVVEGGLPEYVRGTSGLALVGIPHQGWGTAQEPLETYEYLSQRRSLTALDNARALFWTQIPATAPPTLRASIWGSDAPPPWGVPQVQVEQTRLYAYAALAAGMKGLGFQADSDLTSDSGLGRLIEMAFLNAEVRLFSSILSRQDNPAPLIDTFAVEPPPPPSPTQPKLRKEPQPHPTIKAAAISTRDNRGSLVLIMDLAAGAQWQPPQMAVGDKQVLHVTIPTRESVLAYEITLGEVRALDRERVPGGVKVTLPDFSCTSTILLTTDQGLIARMEQAVARIRPRAVLMALDQARWQIEKTSLTYSQLTSFGRGVDEADQLISKADSHLRAACEALEREEYGLAWDEARRVGRPLRVLMRACWNQALEDLVKTTSPQDPTGAKSLITPVASPPLAAFNTLPQHYTWLQFIASHRFGATLLPSGDFNSADAIMRGGWSDASYHYERIPTSISSFALNAQRGDRCLRLAAGPAKKEEVDKLPPFLDHPAIAIRTPAITVQAGQLLRIRVQVRVPRPSVPGAGGLIVKDSIGGEQLQFRTASAIPDWKEVILYRRAAVSGPFFVTLGLAGYGEAFFDDLKIERAEETPISDMAPVYGSGPPVITGPAPIQGAPLPDTVLEAPTLPDPSVRP